MYLDLQIFLTILFYFNFVKSFTDRETLNNKYFKTLQLLPAENTMQGRIHRQHENFVNMTNLQHAAVCKNVFKDLRFEEACIDMEVNILAILMHNGQRCWIILVWVPQLEMYVKQFACVCFIRPAIIALDKPSEYIHYYGSYVMIYPMSIKEVIVFKYDTKQGGFTVLDIFSRKEWTRYNPLKLWEVRIATPQSYSEIRNLRTILSPIFHNLESYSLSPNGLHQSQLSMSVICKLAYRRTRYIQEIYIPVKEKIPRIKERVITILKTENDEPKITFMLAYTCRGYSPIMRTIITKYKIAAGPNYTSVLLLKETVCPNNVFSFQNISPTDDIKCYEIIELIEYLSLQVLWSFTFKDKK